MTQDNKEENGLTEAEKERDRIIQKYDQKLRPFNNKALEPGSPECEQRNAILGEYQSELNKLAEKYYTPERLDTLDELKEFLGDKITFLKMCRTDQKIKTGIDKYPVGLLEGAENYRQKALKAVNKLFKETILSPQQIQQIKLSDLLTGLELLELLVDAEKKAAYTDREQKKGEKPKSQPAKDAKYWFKFVCTVVAGIIILLGGIWTAIQIRESDTFKEFVASLNKSQSAYAPNAQTESNDITLSSKTNYDTSNSLPDLNLPSPESPNQ